MEATLTISSEIKKFNRTETEVLKDSFLLSKEEFIAKYLKEFPTTNKGLLTIGFNKNQLDLADYNEAKLAELLGTQVEESAINVEEVIPTDLSEAPIEFLYEEGATLSDFMNNEAEDVDVLEEAIVKKVKTSSARGHYAHMETTYKKGQVVAFKVPNEDRMVSGIVEKSYFRKNSKSTRLPVYEQVSVFHKNVIHYKTAQVLDKYNGNKKEQHVSN